MYRTRRYLLTAAAHLFLVVASLVAAFLLRFDFVIGTDQRDLLVTGCLIALAVKGVVFGYAGLYRGWTRHAGVEDAWRIIVTGFVASSIFIVVCYAVVGPRFPRSVYLIDLMLSTALIGALRFQLRLFREVILRSWSKRRTTAVLIYGAGTAGYALLRQLRESDTVKLDPVGFLDDDPAKEGSTALGLPIFGPGRKAPAVLERLAKIGTIVEQIIIAMPAATAAEVESAVENCVAAGVRCKTIPSVSEMVDDNYQLANRVRDISVLDLLGRTPIRLDDEQIRQAYTAKNVLVTGAAGSIGSEICRQILRYRPGALVLFDHAESDLYRIDLELRRQFPQADIRVQVGTVREVERVESVLRSNEIQVVVHAAAYKHVPMMEAHPLEVVRTNVLGTGNVVRASSRCGVETFVLISSDKAVNPTNLMGLSKRLAELLVASMESDPENNTRFVSVRFGNVLASNGSVFPLFQSQIANGGPVTVTHQEVRRFFMTISEAVQLVLQASTMGERSNIFVLDMGQLIRIDNLARRMIRLAGLVPDRDIKVDYVGLRPGEKLYEEVISEGEHVLPTHHEKIKIFRGPSLRHTQMTRAITRLEQLVRAQDEPGVVGYMSSIVPEYRPGATWKPVCDAAIGRRTAELAAAGD